MTTATQNYPALTPKTEAQQNSNRALFVFLLGASAMSLMASFSLLAAAVYIH